MLLLSTTHARVAFCRSLREWLCAIDAKEVKVLQVANKTLLLPPPQYANHINAQIRLTQQTMSAKLATAAGANLLCESLAASCARAAR